MVEANSGPSNVPHDLTGRGLFPDVVRFFGLDQPDTTGTGGAGTPEHGLDFLVFRLDDFEALSHRGNGVSGAGSEGID